jgi:monothiol glutaredoxin
MRDDVKGRIEQSIAGSKVVLFMKGTKNFPQCGFSARVVQALKKVGEPFADVNVLADPEVREGIKEYSSWPTIPQLYVDGEFVGGCDIMREMYQSGELQTLLSKAPA